MSSVIFFFHFPSFNEPFRYAATRPRAYRHRPTRVIRNHVDVLSGLPAKCVRRFIGCPIEIERHYCCTVIDLAKRPSTTCNLARVIRVHIGLLPFTHVDFARRLFLKFIRFRALSRSSPEHVLCARSTVPWTRHEISPRSSRIRAKQYATNKTKTKKNT